MEELTNTSNCQPALYVHALAALVALREVFGEFEVGGAAGLSLGEITAHAAAGTFDFATGLKLVQKRGEFMYSTARNAATITSVLIASNRRTPAILPTTYSKRGTGLARIV